VRIAAASASVTANMAAEWEGGAWAASCKAGAWPVRSR
jgi:hypothetical protein